MLQKPKNMLIFAFAMLVWAMCRVGADMSPVKHLTILLIDIIEEFWLRTPRAITTS